MYVLCVCLCLFTFACTFMHICVRLCLYFCYSLFLLYVQVLIHMYICLRLNTHAFLLNICSDNEWMNKLRRKPTSKRKHTHTHTGIPAQAPLFLYFEDDPGSWDVEYQYMFGPDLLVAPVIHKGQVGWEARSGVRICWPWAEVCVWPYTGWGLTIKGVYWNYRVFVEIVGYL